jgi:hypothetical protein
LTGFILRDVRNGALLGIRPDFMVRSAATPRVSNPEAGSLADITATEAFRCFSA